MGMCFHSSQVLYEEFLVLGVVTHGFNHSTQDTEAGGSLWI